jgi:hypothetical protein
MHEFDRGVTRYDIMPIPPVEAHSTRFEAGPVEIWVEYRLLDDAIAAAHTVLQGYEGEIETIEDRGVSLHVFGEVEPDAPMVELLRFDCFDEDPHYHYVSYAAMTNEMVHIEPAAMGDPLQWALERIRTRLPQMVARAGAASLASRLDAAALEAVLPKVAECAYRARFSHDESAIRAGALDHSEAVERASTGERVKP